MRNPDDGYKAKAVKLHEDKPKPDEPKGVSIKVGDVVTLAPGAFALETRSADSASAESSASPSDASDASDEAAKNDVNVVGCCTVTMQNFKGGAK
jgi:hypothetical protein